MRFAFLLGRKEGSVAFELLCQPANPTVVNRLFKEIAAKPDGVAELQLWQDGMGIAKKKRFAAVAGPSEEPVKFAAPVIVAPTLDEVMGAGYPEASALKIIAIEQAMADAQKDNPSLTLDQLLEIGTQVREEMAAAEKAAATTKNSPVIENPGASAGTAVEGAGAGNAAAGTETSVAEPAPSETAPESPSTSSGPAAAGGDQAGPQLDQLLDKDKPKGGSQERAK